MMTAMPMTTMTMTAMTITTMTVTTVTMTAMIMKNLWTQTAQAAVRGDIPAVEAGLNMVVEKDCL